MFREVSDSESLTHSLELNLMEFVDGPDELLKFSSDLTSNERRLIHEVSFVFTHRNASRQCKCDSVMLSSYFTCTCYCRAYVNL